MITSSGNVGGIEFSVGWFSAADETADMPVLDWSASKSTYTRCSRNKMPQRSTWRAGRLSYRYFASLMKSVGLEQFRCSRWTSCLQVRFTLPVVL